MAPSVLLLFVAEIIVNGLCQISFREEVKDYLRLFAQYFVEFEGGERGQADDSAEVFAQIGIECIPEGIMYTLWKKKT